MSPKETEINRMNFLSQRHRGFTYRSMLFALAGWAGFLFLIFCLFLVRETFLKKKVDMIKGSVANLEKQKDQLIRAIETANMGGKNIAAKDDLTAIFTARILWSDVLRGLVRSLPPQVWLDSIEAKKSDSGQMTMRIMGKSKTQRELTNFVMRLEASGLFNRTEIVESKRAGGADNVLDYEIDTIPVVRNP